jgi:hypothetical protein
MADTLRVYCNRCMGETKHGIVRYVLDGNNESETVWWRIVRCNGCESFSFLEVHEAVSEIDGSIEVTSASIFPPRLLRKPKYFVDAPANLDQVYRETIDAFNSNLLLFCAGGLRSLVEGICAAQGVADGPKPDLKNGGFQKNKEGNVIRGSNLECLIEGLAENGILTKALAKALHEHRYLGNEALHELKAPEPDALVKAINILENVMEGLYSVEAQADEITKMRERSRALKSRER